MEHDEIIKLDNDYIAHTYGRFPVVPDHGNGSTIFDVNGKKYIDFTSGIGVNSLGIADAEWVSAVYSQLTKIQHISNYYYSEPSSKLAEILCKNTGMKKVFFGNSGAEANEGAIKTARKYSYDKYGKDRAKIVTLNKSFHGRTVTTLAATGQNVFHDFFFPFTEGFVYVDTNDIDKIESIITDDVCAVMAEPIQGEGGVNILDGEYLRKLEDICHKKDVLVIYDEVQTGIGRTGKLFAYQNYGLSPDIVTSAKGIGGGLPIGAVLLGEKCENTLGYGQHGTTFGANPVVCAGGNVVLERILSDGFLNDVVEKGNYIKKSISEWKLPQIVDIRGLGLMIGIEINNSPKEYAKKAVENGLLVLTAGQNVIRFLPPLVISYDEINEGLEIFKEIMKN